MHCAMYSVWDDNIVVAFITAAVSSGAKWKWVVSISREILATNGALFEIIQKILQGHAEFISDFHIGLCHLFFGFSRKSPFNISHASPCFSSNRRLKRLTLCSSTQSWLTKNGMDVSSQHPLQYLLSQTLPLYNFDASQTSNFVFASHGV